VVGGAVTAFGAAVPIAALGGLIGLGGAEFRLPVLVGPLGYASRRAVPLNLAVSLVTIVAALAIRSQSFTLAPVVPYLPVLFALIAGAMLAALFGTALVHSLSDRAIERLILGLLFVIGCALIVEAFVPNTTGALLPASVVDSRRRGVRAGNRAGEQPARCGGR
jgi:uncharacterized membrane protein YfcA